MRHRSRKGLYLILKLGIQTILLLYSMYILYILYIHTIYTVYTVHTICNLLILSISRSFHLQLHTVTHIQLHTFSYIHTHIHTYKYTYLPNHLPTYLYHTNSTSPPTIDRPPEHALPPHQRSKRQRSLCKPVLHDPFSFFSPSFAWIMFWPSKVKKPTVLYILFVIHG